MKIDDLFWSVSIKEDGSTKVLNDLQSQLKKMQNIIIDINGVVNKDMLAKPFSMQAMTIEQAVNQAKLLEQAYKKIEFPYLDKEAELMRQRWQEIQAELAKYGQLIKSSVMEQSTSVQITEREKQLRQEIADIVGKTGIVQTDAAKKIVQEQIALSGLATERKKLAEAERLGIVSAENLTIAKARITEQEKQHKASIASLESELRNEIKMNQAAAGSMDQLSLKLAKLKNDYRALSAEQRKGTMGEGMLKDIQALDAQLKQMDANIGNHFRNVGNYASGWNGLGNAIQQVAREVPAFTYSVQTGFMAISNNLPILADELKRASQEYKAVKQQIKETGDQTLKAVPVWKQLLSSIFSWQTALVVLITLSTVYGKEIGEWAKNLFRTKKAIDQAKTATDQLNESQRKGTESAQAELVKLNLLYKATQDSTQSVNDRKRAILEMRSLYPDYLKKFSDEQILAGRAAEAYRDLASAILEAARAQAAREKIVENELKILGLRDKMAEAEANQAKAEARLSQLQSDQDVAIIPATNSTDAAAMVAVDNSRIASTAKEIKNYGAEAAEAAREIEILAAANEELAKNVTITSLINPRTNTGGNVDTPAPGGSIEYLNKLISETRKKFSEATTDSQRSFYQGLISDLEAQLKDVQNKLSLYGKNIALEALKGVAIQVDAVIGKWDSLTPQEKKFGKLDTSDLKKAAENTKKVQKNLTISRGDLVNIVKHWDEFTEEDKAAVLNDSLNQISGYLYEAADAVRELDSDIADTIETVGQLVNAVGQLSSGNWIGAAVSMVSGIVSDVAQKTQSTIKESKTIEGTYWDAVNAKIERQIELMKELKGVTEEQVQGTINVAKDEKIEQIWNFDFSKRVGSDWESWMDGAVAGIEKARARGDEETAKKIEEMIRNAEMQVKSNGLKGSKVIWNYYDILSGMNEEQLIELQRIPEIWAILPEELQNYIKELDFIVQKEKEAAESADLIATGVSFDSFRDGFLDVLLDMDSSAEDFANNIEKYLQRAIINGMLSREYDEQIRVWYNKFKAANKDGNIDSVEYASLITDRDAMISGMIEDRDKLKELFNWETTGAASTGQLESGIARASKEDIGVLTGGVIASQGILSDVRNNTFALNMNISAQTNELKRQTALLDAINDYTAEIRDLSQSLPKIEDGVSTIVRRGVEIIN